MLSRCGWEAQSSEISSGIWCLKRRTSEPQFLKSSSTAEKERMRQVSMIALVLSGVGQTFTGTTTITLLQSRVPEQMRGRVMSLNTLLIMGVQPLGDFPAGALISAVGAPDTVLLSAGLVGGYSALVFLIRRSIRSV
jgi:hypothetical protein